MEKFANHISDHNFWVTVTLEQHRFRLSWSSYTWIFLSIGNTTVLHNPQFVDCIDGQMKIRRAINRLCSDFLMCRLLSPQIHIVQRSTFYKEPLQLNSKKNSVGFEKRGFITLFTFHHRKCHLNLPLFFVFLWYSLFVGLVFLFVFVCLFLLKSSEQFQLFSGFCFFFTVFS